MTTAKTLYHDHGDEPFYGPCDYSPIIESFGTVLVRVDDADYSGDTRALIKSGERIGLVNFGWGSCSGCDALQACDTYAEIDTLIAELAAGIKWFDTLDAAKAYIADDANRATEYCYHDGNWQQFKEKVAAYTVSQPL